MQLQCKQNTLLLNSKCSFTIAQEIITINIFFYFVTHSDFDYMSRSRKNYESSTTRI